MTTDKKRVVAVLSDLIFRVKIQDAAKRAGMDAVFVNSQQAALAQAQQQPALIILDLNDNAAKPLELIGQLKCAAETSKINLLGYVSHVQVDVKQAAQERGCDIVLARSAFSRDLQAILQRCADL